MREREEPDARMLRALLAVQRGAEKEKPAATALLGQLSQQIEHSASESR
jgi:hypothetical protein